MKEHMQPITADEAKAIREKFGLTQAEMDARLGIGKDSYRDFERGKRAVPGPAALALRLLVALRDAKRTTTSAIYDAFWG